MERSIVDLTGDDNDDDHHNITIGGGGNCSSDSKKVKKITNVTNNSKVMPMRRNNFVLLGKKSTKLQTRKSAHKVPPRVLLSTTESSLYLIGLDVRVMPSSLVKVFAPYGLVSMETSRRERILVKFRTREQRDKAFDDLNGTDILVNGVRMKWSFQKPSREGSKATSHLKTKSPAKPTSGTPSSSKVVKEKSVSSSKPNQMPEPRSVNDHAVSSTQAASMLRDGVQVSRKSKPPVRMSTSHAPPKPKPPVQMSTSHAPPKAKPPVQISTSHAPPKPKPPVQMSTSHVPPKPKPSVQMSTPHVPDNQSKSSLSSNGARVSQTTVTSPLKSAAAILAKASNSKNVVTSVKNVSQSGDVDRIETTKPRKRIRKGHVAPRTDNEQTQKKRTHSEIAKSNTKDGKAPAQQSPYKNQGRPEAQSNVSATKAHLFNERASKVSRKNDQPESHDSKKRKREETVPFAIKCSCGSTLVIRESWWTVVRCSKCRFVTKVNKVKHFEVPSKKKHKPPNPQQAATRRMVQPPVTSHSSNIASLPRSSGASFPSSQATAKQSTNVATGDGMYIPPPSQSAYTAATSSVSTPKVSHAAKTAVPPSSLRRRSDFSPPKSTPLRVSAPRTSVWKRLNQSTPSSSPSVKFPSSEQSAWKRVAEILSAGQPPSSPSQQIAPSSSQQIAPPPSPQQAPPSSWHQQMAPPSSQQQRMPPPSSQRQQLAPPSSQQHRIAPPSSQRQQLAPPSSQQQRMPPPSSQQHRIAPPSSQRQKLAPPSSQQHRIAPPSSQRQQLAPPSSQQTALQQQPLRPPLPLGNDVSQEQGANTPAASQNLNDQPSHGLYVEQIRLLLRDCSESPWAQQALSFAERLRSAEEFRAYEQLVVECRRAVNGELENMPPSDLVLAECENIQGLHPKVTLLGFVLADMLWLVMNSKRRKNKVLKIEWKSIVHLFVRNGELSVVWRSKTHCEMIIVLMSPALRVLDKRTPNVVAPTFLELLEEFSQKKAVDLNKFSPLPCHRVDQASADGDLYLLSGDVKGVIFVVYGSACVYVDVTDIVGAYDEVGVHFFKFSLNIQRKRADVVFQMPLSSRNSVEEWVSSVLKHLSAPIQHQRRAAPLDISQFRAFKPNTSS